MVLSASFIYFAEHEAQPEAFPDIPGSMWWAIVTLTTVGYGDVYPVTTLGKIFAAFIAILGIGMFALPTGILGASFVEELEKRRHGQNNCPHCGEEIIKKRMKLHLNFSLFLLGLKLNLRNSKPREQDNLHFLRIR